MPLDPELYFDLSMDEIREVARFAVAPVEDALALLDDAPDPRITAAFHAARRFADGEPRSKLQRTTALDAHRAARDATDPVAQHIAAAAADAAASAYLHPFAKGDQVAHILRSSAHAALATEATEPGADGVREVLDQAVRRATPTLRNVLHRYPPFPHGRNRVTQVMCELDLALRQT